MTCKGRSDCGSFSTGSVRTQSGAFRRLAVVSQPAPAPRFSHTPGMAVAPPVVRSPSPSFALCKTLQAPARSARNRGLLKAVGYSDGEVEQLPKNGPVARANL